LYDADGSEVDSWHANNIVDHKATFRFIPNGVYHHIVDRVHPHRHGHKADDNGVGVDTIDGKYGRFGIIRLPPFPANGTVHEGVGIHSGRKSHRGGADHPTYGCIRTTDEAMEAITSHILSDHLESVTVQNNHDQYNPHPHHRGDHHDHRHQHHGAPHHPVLI
jgi:hypothetical protein